jgi:hypothetical protein
MTPDFYSRLVTVTLMDRSQIFHELQKVAGGGLDPRDPLVTQMVLYIEAGLRSQARQNALDFVERKAQEVRL